MSYSYYDKVKKDKLSDASKTECMNRILDQYNEPKFSDTLFYVGQDETPICTIGSALAMQSEYFDKLLYNCNFSQNKKENGKSLDSCYDHINKIFYEPDVTEDVFNYIVQYCHQLHASLSITEDNAVGLLYASNKYLLSTISEECKHFLKSESVTTHNILNIICDLRKFGLQSDGIGKVIESKLSTIMQNGCESLINSEQFLKLPHDVISKHFVKNENCDVKEEILFEKCVEYCKIQTTKLNSIKNVKNDIGIDTDIKTDELSIVAETQAKMAHNDDNWQAMMRSLFLSDIRFPTMSGVYVTETLPKLKLLTNEEMIDILSQMVNTSLKQESCKFIDKHRNNNTNNKNDSNSKRNSSQRGSIHYTLQMSSKYHGPENTYESLISDDTSRGAGTKSGREQWIRARFDNRVKVSTVEVAGAKGMAGNWNQHNINGAWLQYLKGQDEWCNIVKITDVKDNQIKSIEIDVETTAIGLSKDNGFLGTGRLKIKGTSTSSRKSWGQRYSNYDSGW